MFKIEGGSAVRVAQQTTPPAAVRPVLQEIERNYQVAQEAAQDWHPKLWGSVSVGSVGGTQKLTLTEGKLLDRLTRDRGLVGLNEAKKIRDDAFLTADARSPRAGMPPAHVLRQIAALPPGERADALRSWPGNDGHNDAFRHAYWNARMTAEFGEAWTKAFTTAHEGNNPGSSTREAMDLYNNEVGRAIAVANPNASPSQLADAVKQALDEGRLVVIDRSGRLAWSNTVASGDHGMTIGLAAPARIGTPGVVPAAGS